MQDTERTLVMYDVRGIQKYIYKTKKVKDAMGASAMVENIIMDALKYAINTLGLSDDAELAWEDEDGPKPYNEDVEYKVEVLFIGGGNAFVIFESEELCKNVNRLMSKYIIDKTYSLQLAVAMIKKTENYANDYSDLYKRMSYVKANMTASKPLSTLPIMKMEYDTGYPVVEGEEGTETINKRKFKERNIKEGQSKIFDELVTKKGVDSTLAVVHMDGNNMGLRIRALIQNCETYGEAVTRMRKISYNIRESYRKTFRQIKNRIDEISIDMVQKMKKESKYFIREILVAGDDITFVCNAKIAIPVVEQYSREIVKCVMYKDEELTEKENQKRYGFSICAGIAYMGSHFPFDIAYDTAEECCAQAKERAKLEKNMDVIEIEGKKEKRIGNYLDFQICKNIQCRDLKRIRQKEYVTPEGDSLIIRPYYINADHEDIFESMTGNKVYALDSFKKNISYFQKDDQKALPRSFAKKIRNIYPYGKEPMRKIQSFMKSRGHKMPDNGIDMFRDEEGCTAALWYDALEMMDLYDNLDDLWGDKDETNV